MLSFQLIMKFEALNDIQMGYLNKTPGFQTFSQAFLILFMVSSRTSVICNLLYQSVISRCYFRDQPDNLRHADYFCLIGIVNPKVNILS